MGIGPVVGLLMPLEERLVTGQLPGEQRADDGLVVRPPELHVMPVVGARQAFDVLKVEHAAVGLIPTQFQGTFDNRRT